MQGQAQVHRLPGGRLHGAHGARLRYDRLQLRLGLRPGCHEGAPGEDLVGGITSFTAFA